MMKEDIKMQETVTRTSDLSANIANAIERSFANHPNSAVRPLGTVISALAHPRTRENFPEVKELYERNRAAEPLFNKFSDLARAHMGGGGVDSLEFRSKSLRLLEDPSNFKIAKSLDKTDHRDVIQKSVLDVGTLTNFANVTQGQALGYFSLDTNLIRGTIRPGSFTLYASLPKSSAFQIVDFWTTVERTGGAPPGSAFNPFSVASNPSGYALVNASEYQMNTVTLSLMSDARAVSVALAAQNNFVDVAEQETISAALALLSTAEWTSFWGNQSVYAQQFNGLFYTVPNKVDWFGSYVVGGKIAMVDANPTVAVPQSLFNAMMVLQASVAKYTKYGLISHFHMDPDAIADMQSTVTANLQNWVNLHPNMDAERIGRLTDTGPITVAGDIQGFTTRFGQAQFCNSILIPARNVPITAQTEYNTSGNNYLLPSALQPAVSATVLSASASPPNYWNNYSNIVAGWNFLSSTQGYMYAVVACDSNMNETYPVFTTPVIVSNPGSSVQLTITPPNPNTNIVSYRVFRSGLGYNPSSPNPADFRFVGEVAIPAGSTSAVTFIDTNGVDIVGSNGQIYHRFIPGSTTVFGVDMHPSSKALDWRYLLPLTKVELFSGNYLMPWAVVMIGALRNLLPKYHGVIKNYVPVGSSWSPFAPNYGATTFG